MGPSFPPPKKKDHNSLPHFSANICCGQTAGWIEVPLGREVGLGPGDIVLDGTQITPHPQEAQPLQLMAHVYCGQTAGWMKMPLGVEIGLGQGRVVLDGDLFPQRRNTAAPQLSAHVYCGQTAGRIKMPLGTEVGLDAGNIVHN